MKSHYWLGRTASGLLLVACGVALVGLLPLGGRAQDATAKAQDATAKQDPNRDQRIEEIIKRIEELRKQVDELRRESGKATTATEAAKAAATTTPSAPDGTLPAEWVKTLKWRAIGPAGMGGRITAISVFEADPCIWWVATASGGLLKTENNGVTFTHQFDHEATVSIGDVCVAPSDKNVVWVGTGENNPRNSVSYGDGVYKSTDGGKTWTNMGLKKTFQTGRVIVHPKNPDVVYVGALGRLYGPNEERGLFKTSDGGKTWEKVLYVDDKTGVIDVAMHPAEPETLIVAMWERQRDGFDSHRGEPPVAEGYDGYDPFKKWGPGAGLFKTTDGGKTWKKLNANPASGLPTSNFGRTDVDYYRKDPNVVYAIIDCEKIGMGVPPGRAFIGVQGRDGDGGAKLTAITPKSPAEKAGLKVGDLIKAVDKNPITGYAQLTAALRTKQAGDKLALEVTREGQTQQIEVTLEKRPLGAVVPATGGAYLGIQGEDADNGARLTQITEGGPASKVDLRAGDVIKAADKQPIMSYEQLTEMLRGHAPGDKVQFEVLRDEKTIEIVATLEERPSGPGGFGGGGFGGGLAGLLGAFAEDVEGGVRVTRVFDDRLAQKSGIEDGDVLKELDGKPVADIEQLVATLREHREDDKVTFKVEREKDKGEKETKEIVVTLEAPGAGSRTRPYAFMYAGQQPNVQEQQGPNSHEYGGVYKSTDGGETWTRINSLNPRPMYFSQIRVDPSDDKYLYVLGVSLHRSKDGGKTFTADGGNRVHADQHTLWIDPRDGRHMIVGTDGGFYATWDRMTHWEHLNHLAIAQFYHVAVDTRQPYRVYGGLQDNGSWGGPSRALGGSGPLNEDWISVGGGDGFVCRVDPFDPDIVYSESQDGNIGRRNLRTGERASIRARGAPGRGASGGPAQAPSPSEGQPGSPRAPRYRFNWNTPFILSNHNPGIFYSAGNFVFRSVKRGDELKVISPEISRTGRGTATALAESPRNPDVLWVGSDDGNLWITRDGGVKWTNIADKVGLPGPRWVATIEPSRFAEGRCHVAFDAHRSDDDEPHVYVTEDFGETWKSLRANLPSGSTRCLREDPKNANLLFVGTEFACWASLNRGQSWTRLNNNLPTVAVHELAIHPTAGEMVAATHGRSLWVLDITPLRQMTTEVVKADAFLFEPNAVVRWRSEPSRGTGGGSQRFVGENPSRGVQICYSLAKKPEKISLKVLDHTGATVRELQAKPDCGLNAVAWDLTRTPRAGGPGRGRFGGGAGEGSDPAGQPNRAQGQRRSPSGERAAEQPPAGEAGAAQAEQAQRGRPPGFAPGQQQRAGAGGGPPFGGQSVAPGLYRVVLTVDGREFTQTLRVESDPTLPVNTVVVDFGPEEDEEEEEREREAATIRYIDD